MLAKAKKLLKKIDGIDFIRDVSIIQIGQFFAMGVGIIAGIIYARGLGKELFGLYGVIIAFAGTFNLFTEIGQSYTTITLLPEAVKEKDTEKIKKILGYYLRITTIYTSVIILISILLAPYVSNIVYGDMGIGLMAQIVLLNILVVFSINVSLIVLQSIRKIGALTIYESIYQSLLNGLPVILVLMGLGIKGILYGQLMVNIVFGFATVVVYHEISKRISYMPKFREIVSQAIKAKSPKKYLKMSIWVSINKNESKLTEIIPIYLLMWLSGAAAVGIFKIFKAYVNLSMSLSSSVGRMLSSVLPQLKASSTKKVIMRNFWKANIINMIATYVFLIPLVLLGNVGVKFIFGEEYMMKNIYFYLMLFWGINGLSVGIGAFIRTFDKLKISTVLLAIGHVLGMIGFGITYLLWQDAILSAITFLILVYFSSFLLIHFYVYKPFAENEKGKGCLITFLFHGIFRDEEEIQKNVVNPQQKTTIKQLHELIEHYLEEGYTFVSPDDIKEGLNENKKHAMITFDDGYFNNKLILPILNKYKVPAVFFISTNNIKKNECYWWDILYRERKKQGVSSKKIAEEGRILKAMPTQKIMKHLAKTFEEEALKPIGDIDRPFTPSELKEFSKEKYVFIGNHTQDHALLHNYSWDEIRAQITGCQRDLKEMTGITPIIISYPNGSYSPEIIDISKESGLELGILVKARKVDLPIDFSSIEPFTLGRFVVWGDKPLKKQLKKCQK